MADDLAAARNTCRLTPPQQKVRSPRSITCIFRRAPRRPGKPVATAQAQAQVNNASLDRSRVLLESREREAANAKEQLAATQQQLADLQAKQTDRGVVVTMGDVLFDTGRATLKPGAVAVLDRLAAYMQSSPQTRLVIEGHTDSTGSLATNEELSQRRADAVASGLIQRGSGGSLRGRRARERFARGEQCHAGRDASRTRRVEVISPTARDAPSTDADSLTTPTHSPAGGHGRRPLQAGPARPSRLGRQST